MSSVLLGIDIGGTKSAVVVGNSNGAILDRVQFATDDRDATIARIIDEACKLHASSRAIACGISCGGPLSSRRGRILSPPNLPGWDEVPIVQMLRDALKVPVALENDANAAALAEWDWGLKRQVDDLAYLTCGTGQGAGIILGGRLHRGQSDLAGEIGHVRLRGDGPMGYGKAGSVEGFTSGKGLVAIATQTLAASSEKSQLRDHAQLNGKIIGEAALAGDAIALSAVERLGGYLGETCALLIDLLNPQRISLGSMVVRLGELLLKSVRTSAGNEALPQAFTNCVIAPAALGERVQDLAAIAVAQTAAGEL